MCILLWITNSYRSIMTIYFFLYRYTIKIGLFILTMYMQMYRCLCINRKFKYTKHFRRFLHNMQKYKNIVRKTYIVI